MNSGKLTKLAFVIILVLVVAALLYNPIVKNIILGLDLQGGVHVVLNATNEDGTTPSKEDMNQLKMVMWERVDELGVTEPSIQLSGQDRLIVELAGIDNPRMEKPS